MRATASTSDVAIILKRAHQKMVKAVDTVWKVGPEGLLIESEPTGDNGLGIERDGCRQRTRSGGLSLY